MRQHFRFVFSHLREPFLQRRSDLEMELLAPGLQQRLVCRVLHQRMLELIGHVRREAAPIDQPRRRQLRQRIVERHLVEG